ncbi:MAG: helix-turn-helix domain-containing protein [Clostridiales bacterium]|jgi:transcriptional regulator with XRE-family HTH domain|nr:helix-turn-helix domain-containing protein [Clostridiales bacterium]
MEKSGGFNFGKRLRELRVEKGWNQRYLAGLLGMSQSNLSLWEGGQSLPDFMSVRKLAGIFDVSADYLLGLSEY